MQARNTRHGVASVSNMIGGRRAWVALAALWAMMAVSQATPLYLEGGTPDIMSDWITISFNSQSGAFTANGSALFLDEATIYNGTFSLSTTIVSDPARGWVISGGTLTIQGSLTEQGSVVDLLTADLTDFGFPNESGNPVTFEFLSAVTSGSLASDFGGANAPVGTNLTSFDLDPTWDGTFSQSYSNCTGAADTTPVIPEPASASIVLGGVLVLLARRRRLARLSQEHRSA